MQTTIEEKEVILRIYNMYLHIYLIQTHINLSRCSLKVRFHRLLSLLFIFNLRNNAKGLINWYMKFDVDKMLLRTEEDQFVVPDDIP